jgi:hypothetical protein
MEGRMYPFDVLWTKLRMGLIQLHARHLDLTGDLPMVNLGAVGSHALKPMDGLERHATDIGGPLVTDAPPLTLEQPFDRLFWQLTPGHQGPCPLGELLVAHRASQPFDMLVLACPRSMGDVAFTGAIKQRTFWSGARKRRIPFLRWRRRYHVGPPLAGNGLKDIDLTPVLLR